MSEDITYCTNRGCKLEKCHRNQSHIKMFFLHSFADFDGVYPYCLKTHYEMCPKCRQEPLRTDQGVVECSKCGYWRFAKE